MKSIRHPRTARDPLLRVETDGCIVDIEVGLTDADGRRVTRVDILPDDESRGGDGTGHIWRQDGPRIIRLERDDARPEAPPAREDANDGPTPRIAFTITGGGESLADVEFAVLEALERIKNGNVLGFDRNETGSFHFEVEGQEEETRHEHSHAFAACECYLDCAEDPATGCSLSGIWHVHAGERCPVHPDAPGDH